MRILALNWRCLRHPDAGGAEANLFEQARRWALAGHEVTVLCADPGRRAVAQRDEDLDGIAIRRRGGRFTVYLRAAGYLVRCGRRFDCILDVANGVPFFAPLFTRTPVVLLVHHVHGDQWRQEVAWPLSAFGRRLEERLVPRVYAGAPVIAVSPSTRDGLCALGVRRDAITVIFNGVAPPAATAAGSRRGVVYVGRLKRYKRLERLVRAVAAIQHDVPDVTLHVAGDGDARGELEALVGSLGLQDRVTVHGRVSEAEKERLLHGAAVFATPSMHEGWGLGVVEANACGCPAVAYDVPGLNVAIHDGVTGLLARDDQDFQAHLRRLLTDAPLRGRMSAAARTWAGTFSWDACADETLAVMRRESGPA